MDDSSVPGSHLAVLTCQKAEGRIRLQQMGLANLTLKHAGKTEAVASLERCRQAQPGQSEHWEVRRRHRGCKFKLDFFFKGSIMLNGGSQAQKPRAA